MQSFLKKGLETIRAVADKATDEFSAGYSLVKEKVNGLPIFVSAEQSDNFGDIEYDEKHYFVIPFELSEYQFALHTMRCLPTGVPEINNLPKRRVFHFPNEHAETLLKHYMHQSAVTKVAENNENHPHTLESLANQIDKLDQKLTYGMLLVGGVTAIVNPLLGAGIAAKALIPGVGSLLNKYGLRPTGEMLTQRNLEKSIKDAEEHINKEFSAANTLQVINPILQELEFALQTDASQHDPLTDPNLSDGAFFEPNNTSKTYTRNETEHWRTLTEVAICHVYKDVYNDPAKHKGAKLGPEDLRWLKTLIDGNEIGD